MRFPFLILAIFLYGQMFSQNAVSKEIQSLKSEGKTWNEFSLLKYQTNDVQRRSLNLQGLQKGTIFNLDQDVVQKMYEGKNDFIHIPVALTNDTTMMLTLERNQIFTNEFALYTSSDPLTPVDYNPGLHYKGIVEGMPSSIVALSVFHDQIMGIITTDHGNFVLGAIKGDRENNYVFYNDKDLDRKSDFICGTIDDGLGYTEDQLKEVAHGRDAGDCVRLYIEINRDIVLDKGGVTGATNFITGLYNQSFVLYSNDGISMMINQIMAWTTNSPYTGATAAAMLSSYQANTGSFNGNLSDLVSYSASGGISAGFAGICNPNPDLSKCFCSINSGYSNVPTFSWSVMVITHEMGHLLGSHHTHACVWNGNNTAIDGCAGVVEGSCPLPGNPVQGGTIMSYCHLQSCGINFTLGFGPQPGNIIRHTVNAAGNCLTPPGPPPPPPPLPSYCASTGTNSNFEYIKKVVLGSISNLSGNNSGYGNYISLSTNLNAGSNIIELTPGYKGNAFNETWRVWIDYNNDHDWLDAGEQVAQGSGTVPINLSFIVPTSNITYTTRMRVSMQFNSPSPVCGSFTYGEVEDYTVVILGTAPPTCTDGIQNQGETGVDCGGPCTPCAPVPNSILLASYFETGWDSWIDGGSDANRVKSVNSWEGSYSIKLDGNAGTQSSMTSPVFNLSKAIGVQISFHFYTVSMESGKDFLVQYKNSKGGWSTIGTYEIGRNFNNNTFYTSTIVVPNFVQDTAGSFRIQCHAGDISDQIFVDAVIISGLNGSSLIEPGLNIQEDGLKPGRSNYDIDSDNKDLSVYPNPAQDVLNIQFDGKIQAIRIFSLEGKEWIFDKINDERNTIDISYLSQGIYFLSVQSNGEWYPTRFSKM